MSGVRIPKAFGREGVAKLVQQHAEKDQQRKSHPIHRRLQTTIRVVDPRIEPEEQKKSQVDSHLNAGNTWLCGRTISPFGTMAEESIEASVFRNPSR